MSQKFENLLNLALETPEAVRLETQQLNSGYNASQNTWELIVKYHDTLDMLIPYGITVEYLIAGYAILTVPEELVESLSSVPSIEFVEKPKRYYFSPTTSSSPFSRTDFLEDACVYPITRRAPFLTGEGVLVAVIDSGIDYTREEFRNPDGSTRILYLWDQTSPEGPAPEGFSQGREYTAAQLNEALISGIRFPITDNSGHGTAVTGIAAASGTTSGYTGVAPLSKLLIVKLGLPSEDGFPRTTEIMRAVTYAVRTGNALNLPLVINLSFGNTYGSHDGSSLLERFLDNASEIGRTVICAGSGNEGNSNGHAQVLLSPDTFAGSAASPQRTENPVRLTVGSYERSLSVQIWSHYSDRFRLFLRSPSGSLLELSPETNSGKASYLLDSTRLLAYYGEPSPYSVARELYLELLPEGQSYLPSGIWEFRAEPIRITDGSLYYYLPAFAGRNARTGFLTPTPQVTLTIPSTASRVITVGAYDSRYDSYADFSGRGYESTGRTIGIVTSGLVKPDLAAPGVDLPAPDLYGGFTTVTGTSFATPIVSGVSALLMEWGIVQGNDPYLYGEKIKAYLRSGARPIRGIMNYPNNRVGFGALCAAESLPL